MKPGIVTEQKIDKTKLQLAKEFRKDQTAAEKILWNALRNNQLNGLHFRRQQVIDGFIVDFYCHSAGLMIEVDGEVHYEREIEDQARDEILQRRDLRLLRFTNNQILGNLAKVLAAIKEVADSPLPLREGAGG